MTVSLPGEPVLAARTHGRRGGRGRLGMPRQRVLHVGRSAPAWVLLEAFPDRVVVSVRDEGPGIPAGRLEAAQTDGRLGVAESIRGRITDLGGTAELTTGIYGTEWELTVPLGSLRAARFRARRLSCGVVLPGRELPLGPRARSRRPRRA